jgi:antitoxin (DNA-binding transcriptional repressor) of toxin-antitoxin stability system
MTIVAGGEVIVTKRGKPIAKTLSREVPGGEEEQRLRAMERRGLLRLGSGKLAKAFWNARRPADPAGLIRKALIEEREEGR